MYLVAISVALLAIAWWLVAGGSSDMQFLGDHY